MFEQDYIMRIIREMVRTILKLLFNIDTEFPDVQMLENKESIETAEKLIKMVDDGMINDAENYLYDIIEDKTNDNLLLGLIFYSHLNEMDEKFLSDNDFSQDEVKEGLEYLLSIYGVEELVL